jgi:hypothetical protein
LVWWFLKVWQCFDMTFRSWWVECPVESPIYDYCVGFKSFKEKFEHFTVVHISRSIKMTFSGAQQDIILSSVCKLIRLFNAMCWCLSGLLCWDAANYWEWCVGFEFGYELYWEFIWWSLKLVQFAWLPCLMTLF